MADYTSDRSGASIDLVLDNADAGNIGKAILKETSIDLDTIAFTGFKYITGAINGPSGVTTVLVNTVYTAADATRAYQQLHDATSNVFFFRNLLGGVWQAWEEIYHTGNAASLPLTTAFAPADDNVRTLGDASGRWSEVFAGNGTINTSDARKKTSVSNLEDNELKAAIQLSKEIGTYKFLSAINLKGNEARTHTGLTVQRAIEIMEANNLVAESYAFICFDKWDDKFEVTPAVNDEDGNEIAPEEKVLVKEAGDIYGFRYDQLNQFILAGIAARLDAAGL